MVKRKIFEDMVNLYPVLKFSTEGDNLQSQISEKDFITNNVNAAGYNTDHIGYKLFVFDTIP